MPTVTLKTDAMYNMHMQTWTTASFLVQQQQFNLASFKNDINLDNNSTDFSRNDGNIQVFQSPKPINTLSKQLSPINVTC